MLIFKITATFRASVLFFFCHVHNYREAAVDSEVSLSKAEMRRYFCLVFYCYVFSFVAYFKVDRVKD